MGGQNAREREERSLRGLGQARKEVGIGINGNLYNDHPLGEVLRYRTPFNFAVNWSTLQAAKFEFAKLESLTLL